MVVTLSPWPPAAFTLVVLLVWLGTKVKPKSRMHLGQDLSLYPPGIVNQYDEERNYLKFHRCVNEGEAFSGSWLTTTMHLLSHNSSYDLATANGELAAFLVIETRRSRKAWSPVGALMQTLDVLDLSVIHLSAYERLYRKYGFSIEAPKVAADIKSAMERSASLLESHARERERQRAGATMNLKDAFDLASTGRRSPPTPPKGGRRSAVLALHPWLGSVKGYSHSETTFRLAYLRACMWSSLALTRDVVVGVVSEEDRRLILEAKLPAFEVIVFPSLPSTTALPVALVQWAQRALSPGGGLSKAGYRYVFYSEADQVLVLRPGMQRHLEEFLTRYKRRVLVPHRLIPYPGAVLDGFNRSLPASAGVREGEGVVKAAVGTVSLQDIYRATIGSSSPPPPAGRGQGQEWAAHQCCLPRQNCETREQWRKPWDRRRDGEEFFLPLVWLQGLPTALGNSDFYHENYRVCTLSPLEEGGVCP